MDNFDQLTQAVTALWPTYKTTKAQLWAITNGGRWLKRYGIEAIEAALFEHRGEFPDDVRPNWRMVNRALWEQEQKAKEK